jgi:purine nucleosidase
MPRRPFVFDVDPGIDDALALLLALGHPDIAVLGIGTVAGNVGVAQCTANALALLALVGREEVPVAEGCRRALLAPPRRSVGVHGDSGLGGVVLPGGSRSASGEHAVDQLLRLARQHAGALTLVALGPLTNVAVALLREPDLPRLLGRVVVMGGAFAHPGNVTATAEFNIWADPEAARVVLEAGLDLTLVPLDATMRVLLDEPGLARLGAGPVGDAARAMTRHYLTSYTERHGRPAAAMHDPLATAIAIEAGLMRDAPVVPVTVETAGQWTRGMTVADWRPWAGADAPPGRARVCRQADADGFFAMFEAALARH